MKKRIGITFLLIVLYCNLLADPSANKKKGFMEYRLAPVFGIDVVPMLGYCAKAGLQITEKPLKLSVLAEYNNFNQKYGGVWYGEYDGTITASVKLFNIMIITPPSSWYFQAFMNISTGIADFELKSKNNDFELEKSNFVWCIGAGIKWTIITAGIKYYGPGVSFFEEYRVIDETIVNPIDENYKNDYEVHTGPILTIGLMFYY